MLSKTGASCHTGNVGLSHKLKGFEPKVQLHKCVNRENVPKGNLQFIDTDSKRIHSFENMKNNQKLKINQST